MTNRNLDPYYQALERIKSGKPRFVAKGIRITNDAVSLEAGRKKGSIKKSRSTFAELIANIELAAAEQRLPQEGRAENRHKEKQKVGNLQVELDNALGREYSLLIELFETKMKLAKLTGEGVLPIRGNKPLTTL